MNSKLFSTTLNAALLLLTPCLNAQSIISRTDQPNGRFVSFATQPGNTYYFVSAATLDFGSPWQSTVFIADGSNSTFYCESTNAAGFYALIPGDSRITFPDWMPFIEQCSYVDCATSITNATYRLDVYADDAPAGSISGQVPTNGLFGAYDASYDPSLWPRAGLYNVSQWRFEITVTPNDPKQAPATSVATKQGRRRNPQYRGVTTSLNGALGIMSDLNQQELDAYNQVYFLANYQGAQQIDFAGNLIDPAGYPPVLYSSNDWTGLLNTLERAADHFHYFGHGSATQIGWHAADRPGEQITVGMIQASGIATNPLVYVALDGCRTAATPALLQAFVGYGKVVRKGDMITRGLLPRFGWGWNEGKNVTFIQGSLLDSHFDFVTDFYTKLTARDVSGSYMLNTYEDAYKFAKAPMGAGNNPSIDVNYEAKGWVSVGCLDCFFDE